MVIHAVVTLKLLAEQTLMVCGPALLLHALLLT
jgi:hypothetical protein